MITMTLSRWWPWEVQRGSVTMSPLLHWLLPHLHYPRYHCPYHHYDHRQHGCHQHHHHLCIKCDQMLCSALITSWIFTKLIVLPNALLGPVCIAISKDYCHALDTAFIYKITLLCKLQYSPHYINWALSALEYGGHEFLGLVCRRYHWQSKNDLTNLRAE